MKSEKISKSAHRKDEHLALAKASYQANQANSFDDLRLTRPTLPETVVTPDSIRTTMFGHTLSAPFFINAITGGSNKGQEINAALARVAKKANIALALGSANIVAHEPATLKTFTIARAANPDGTLLINVNPGTPLATIKLLINELRPAALQIHVNAVQELIMPEGDRDFQWVNKMMQIRDAVDLPVIVKEVGFGFDVKSLRLLEQNGFNYVDVAGSGGTDFAWIENFRRPGRDMDYLEGIGIPTVEALLTARQTNLTYFASGGIRNPLDVLKSMVLGASAVGISNRFLQEYNQNGEAGLLKLVTNWQDQLAGLVALFGGNDLADLKKMQFDYRLR